MSVLGRIVVNATALCAVALFSCTYDPKIDANGFTCRVPAACPAGYACVNATVSQPGVCCSHLDSGMCSTPDGNDSSRDGTSLDVSGTLKDAGGSSRDEADDLPLAPDLGAQPDDSKPSLAEAGGEPTFSDSASPSDLPPDIADAPGGGADSQPGQAPDVPTPDGRPPSDVTSPFDLPFADVPVSGSDGGGGQADGAGETSGTETGSTSPSVISVIPAASGTGVAPTSVISATFSTAMDGGTFTAATFAVKLGGVSVLGNVTAAGSTATFTPSRPLVLLASYQVTIAGAVKSATGTAMGADFSWAFTVRDGSYGASRAVSATGHNLDGLVLAATAAGDAMAAWEQFDSPPNARTYSAQFSPSAGWFAPALVDMGDVSSTSPALAMSDDGSALTVFVTPTGTVSSRLVEGSNWSAPIALASTTANLSLAMDGAGKAVAAYEAGGPVNVKNFTAAAGWGGEQMLTGDAIFPQVALTAAGTGVASFNAFVTSGGEQVNVARYTGSAWLTAEPVSAAGTTGNFSAVSIDSAGIPIVLWSDSGVAFSSRFTAGSWGAAEMVGPAPDSGEVIALSQEPTDNIVAVMSTLPGTQPADLRANILSGGAWRIVKKLNVNNDPITGGPSAAVAPNGNAIVVWIQGGEVWVARQIEGTGWTTSQLLPDGVATTLSGAPRVRIDASGRATIVFVRDDTTTTRHVRAIRFE